MAALRRDAHRNRERILASARALRAEGEPVLLNGVARHAEVGVATVYRHFPSVEALTEALVEHRYVEMAEDARSAANEPNDFVATRAFIARSLQTYIDDPDFAESVLAATAVRDDTRVLRAELFSAFSALVAGSAPSFRPGLEPTDIMVLLCGLGHAARLRPDRSAQYLDALFGGILAE